MASTAVPSSDPVPSPDCPTSTTASDGSFATAPDTQHTLDTQPSAAGASGIPGAIAPGGELLAPPEAPATRSLLFRIAGHEYVCPVSVLREVLPSSPTTRIPRTSSLIVGLRNVRGTIITVVDGGIFLHDVPCDRQSGSVLLIDMGARPVGLLVDRVLDIRQVRSGDDYHPLDLRDLAARVVAISETE